MEFTFELEKYVVINYSMAIEEGEDRDTNPDSPTFGPGFEASCEVDGIEIVITSDSIIDHLTILGELAANYSDEDISKAAMEDYEANHQPEPDCDDREPEEFDHESYYRDLP